jgi:cell division protein ZapA
MNRVVQVEIHGQRYAIRSDLDPQYISQLALYFDQKMRLASDEIHHADTLCVAVIAALNIADELFRAKADGDGLESRVRLRAAEIERLVDTVLDSARTQAIAANS